LVRRNECVPKTNSKWDDYEGLRIVNFERLHSISALLNSTIDTERFERDFSDKQKRDWLSKIVERIDIFYRHEDQVHELNLMLKIPLFSDELLGI